MVGEEALAGETKEEKGLEVAAKGSITRPGDSEDATTPKQALTLRSTLATYPRHWADTPGQVRVPDVVRLPHNPLDPPGVLQHQRGDAKPQAYKGQDPQKGPKGPGTRALCALRPSMGHGHD